MERQGEVRRDVSEYQDYAIFVSTERMKDGQWGVVARAVHHTPTAEDVFPVAVPEQRFATEEEARQFGFQTAREWIDHNTSHAA